MGWAEQLPSGRWRARYRAAGRARILKKPDGSPHTFTSKAEAIRKANAREDEMRQPGAVLPGAGKITWGEWCDQWWPQHQKTIEANSIATYASNLANWIRPRWEDDPLDTIARGDVQDWVTGMDAAPATVHVIYSLFSASMRAAAGTLIPGTPCVNIELPTIEPPDIHFLSRAEFDILLRFLTGPWRMLALLCVGTGMRWGEAVALHWQDVHASTITIRFAYSWRGRYVKPYPKNETHRTVPLPPWLGLELGAWRASLPAAGRCGSPHRAAKRRRQDVPVARCRSGLVIPHESGGCLPYTTSNQTFRRAVELAQIGHTTIHDLRDTYASWLLQSRQVTIEQVAELVGHADVNLTRRRYARFGSSQFDHVASALGSPDLGSAPIQPQSAGRKIVDLASRRRPEAI